jgi:hypothetical protein
MPGGEGTSVLAWCLGLSKAPSREASVGPGHATELRECERVQLCDLARVSGLSPVRRRWRLRLRGAKPLSPRVPRPRLKRVRAPRQQQTVPLRRTRRQLLHNPPRRRALKQALPTNPPQHQPLLRLRFSRRRERVRSMGPPTSFDCGTWKLASTNSRSRFDEVTRG